MLLCNFPYLIINYKGTYSLRDTIVSTTTQVKGSYSSFVNPYFFEFEFRNLLTLKFNALMDILIKFGNTSIKTMA